MPFAFVTDATVALTLSAPRQLAPCSLRGRQVRVAPARRVMPHVRTACVAVKAQSGATEEEEETLDEVAMRAAEIHEVLVGLQEFKQRIIDDATTLAKKVRAPKKQLKAALEAHPDIKKIDGHIEELEKELKELGDR